MQFNSNQALDTYLILNSIQFNWGRIELNWIVRNPDSFLCSSLDIPRNPYPLDPDHPILTAFYVTHQTLIMSHDPILKTASYDPGLFLTVAPGRLQADIAERYRHMCNYYIAFIDSQLFQTYGFPEAGPEDEN
jgi:hypothetical protein